MYPNNKCEWRGKKTHTIESYAFYLFDHVRLLKPDFGCKSSKIMQWKRIKCPFNAHLKRVHRECIVQPITLRIHEHFQCLNEKVMFYIRIAHNKRLRDVNIVCARLLIRCACCCKIGSFSCSIQLSLNVVFSSIFPLFPPSSEAAAILVGLECIVQCSLWTDYACLCDT